MNVLALVVVLLFFSSRTCASGYKEEFFMAGSKQNSPKGGEVIGKTQHANVYGFQMDYVLAGQGLGDPPIVLLTGYGGDMNISWKKMFSALTSISTVVAYDRLNYGNSDPSALGVPQTGTEIIVFLRSLLQDELELSPPYVLVGHSIGGLYSQLYAKQYPNEIAGVVLIDSSHPDQMERLEELREQDLIITRRNANRLFEDISNFIFSCINPRQFTEIKNWDDTVNQINDASDFPDIPLSVITATKVAFWEYLLLDVDGFFKVWQELQMDLASMSPQGQQILALNSCHFVQDTEPELVVQAIKDVVTTVREQGAT